uniref:Uncharacterized protein n=1 Tax=Magallana gigas TaxID=29159 RepID=A0A8W8P295_MAGGI
MDSGRKKQFRFSEQDDIKMLREVISRNPFKDRGKWLEISLALPMSVDARRVRERTVLLMEQRRKANSSSLKKSGVDEVYGEKEILLDEILDLANDEEEKKKDYLANDEEEKKKDDKSKAIKEEVLCKDIRKRALDNLTPSKSDENLKKMPKKSASVMSFLKEKAELEKKSQRKMSLRFVANSSI